MQPQSKIPLRVEMKGKLHLVAVVEDLRRSLALVNFYSFQSADPLDTVYHLLSLEQQLLLVREILPGAATAIGKMLTGSRDTEVRLLDDLPDFGFVVARLGPRNFRQHSLPRQPSVEEDNFTVHVADCLAV